MFNPVLIGYLKPKNTRPIEISSFHVGFSQFRSQPDHQFMPFHSHFAENFNSPHPYIFVFTRAVFALLSQLLTQVPSKVPSSIKFSSILSTCGNRILLLATSTSIEYLLVEVSKTGPGSLDQMDGFVEKCVREILGQLDVGVG